MISGPSSEGKYEGWKGESGGERGVVRGMWWLRSALRHLVCVSMFLTH
jgi:hypothetical protein